MSWHDPLPSADGDTAASDAGFGPTPSGGSWSHASGNSPSAAPAAPQSAPSGWGTGTADSWTGDDGARTSVAGGPDSTKAAAATSDSGILGLGRPASPPMIWLGVAAVLVLAGLSFFFLGHGATAGLYGWLLAGPAAISVLGVFIVMDAKRAETGWYRSSELAAWGRRSIVGLALIAVALNSFLIANDVARGLWR